MKLFLSLVTGVALLPIFSTGTLAATAQGKLLTELNVIPTRVLKDRSAQSSTRA